MTDSENAQSIRYTDLIVPTKKKWHFSLATLFIFVSVAGPLALACPKLPQVFYSAVGGLLSTVAALMLCAWWISYVRPIYLTAPWVVLSVVTYCLTERFDTFANFLSEFKRLESLPLILLLTAFGATAVTLGILLSISRYAD